MKFAVILLSTLSLAAAANPYPGRYPGSGGGGGQIIFPGQGQGHIHDQKHPHGQPGSGGRPGGGRPGGFRPGGSRPGGGSFQQFRRPEDFFGRLDESKCPGFVSNKAHLIEDGRQYHFSWCADGGQRYTWQQAQDYCHRLGDGWFAVSIEDSVENDIIVNIIGTHVIPWIWTAGNRTSSDPRLFEWSRGFSRSPIGYSNWGQTGAQLSPQPDNAENNNERCLALLNQFYDNDGITWHDIGCFHDKPTICEFYGGSGGSRPIGPIHSGGSGGSGHHGNQGHVVPPYG